MVPSAQIIGTKKLPATVGPHAEVLCTKGKAGDSRAFRPLENFHLFFWHK